MTKDQDLLDTLKKISDKLQKRSHYSGRFSPRSVDSKPIFQFNTLYDHSNQRYSKYLNKLSPYHENINLSSLKKQVLVNNIDSKYQQKQNFFHKNRHFRKYSSIQELQINKHAKNLVRSQSANQVYKSSRIEMLSRINFLLQNQASKQKISNLKQKESEKDFKYQINQKIDRLQRYLFKIKKQRAKQQIPTKTLVNEIRNNNSQKQRIKDEDKIYIGKAFHQLDKIKNELAELRKQAIEVQKINSLQKNSPKKIIKAFQYTPQKSQLLQIPLKTIRPKAPEANLPSSNFKIEEIHKVLSPEKFKTISSYGLSSLNQTSTLSFQKRTNAQMPNLGMKFTENQYTLKSYSSQKPKVTFSFNK